jgi:hypothetical protein
MQDRIAIFLPVRNFGTERYKRLIRCLDSYNEFTDGYSDVFVIHDNDECNIYDPIVANYPNVKTLCVQSGITLMQKINIHAMDIANEYKYMGFIGDDIVFRTKWEREFIDALSSHKFVLAYGNDLMYTRGDLATHPFITSNMFRALGFFGCPAVGHHYFDNYWMDMIQCVGLKKFLPSVIMEHMHPAMNKEEPDDGYITIESKFYENNVNYKMYIKDKHFENDVNKVLAYVE